MPANQTMPDQKKRDTAVYDLESPFDFCEMMAVAWIRLLASAGHAALSFAAPRSSQAESQRHQPAKASDKTEEENELLLHVLG